MKDNKTGRDAKKTYRETGGRGATMRTIAGQGTQTAKETTKVGGEANGQRCKRRGRGNKMWEDNGGGHDDRW